MSKIQPVHKSDISAVDEDTLSRILAAEKALKKLPQIQLTTWHTLHAGIYSRTILLQKGEVVTSCLIRVPTTVTVSGHVVICGSDGGSKTVKGYHVLTAEGNRKQVVCALEDSYITMQFICNCKTIEDAEAFFTNDADQLMSRTRPDAINHVCITGIQPELNPPSNLKEDNTLCQAQ